MASWQDLIQISTLGLNRMRLSDAISKDWLREIEWSEDTEQRLLELAGTFTLARKAGYKPIIIEKTEKLSFPKPETAPYISASATKSLSRILNGSSRELFGEMIGLTLQCEKIFPPEYLPRLFRWAIHARLFSDHILKVGGNRGRWLIDLNPDWKVFLPPEKADWDSGEMGERVNYLSWLRKTQPDEARDLLLSVKSNETPAHLAKFVSVFQENLSKTDLPLLESLENHRRKEVRVATRKLLIKLPDSQLVIRMEDRLKQVIELEKGLIRDSLAINPVGEITKELKKDGINGEVSAGLKLGKRAAILGQMASYVPPSFWEEWLEKSSEDIFTMVFRSDWAEALLYGMAAAANNYRDFHWAETFIQFWLSDLSEREQKKLETMKPFIPQLLHLVPVGQLDKLLYQSIKKIRHPDQNMNGLLLLEYLRAPISPKTAIIFAEKIVGILGTFGNRIDYRFRAFVYELAKSVYCFPPEVYSQVANIWAMNPYETNWYDPYVDRALKLLEFRHRMKKEVEA